MNKKYEANRAIHDMNNLVKLFIAEIRHNSLHDDIKGFVLEKKLILDNIPQNFYVFEYKGKQVWIQMLKPNLNPVFYFVDKEGIHIFTDVLKEAYMFLTEQILLSRSTRG